MKRPKTIDIRSRANRQFAGMRQWSSIVGMSGVTAALDRAMTDGVSREDAEIIANVSWPDDLVAGLNDIFDDAGIAH